MIKQELVEYFESIHELDPKLDEILPTLIASGWLEEDIRETFASVYKDKSDEGLKSLQYLQQDKKILSRLSSPRVKMLLGVLLLVGITVLFFLFNFLKEDDTLVNSDFTTPPGDHVSEEISLTSSESEPCLVQSKNLPSIVDSSSFGPYVKGLEFSDQKGNIITIYVPNYDKLPDFSVEMRDCINLGAPEGYEIITNEFIEFKFPDSVVEIEDWTYTIAVKTVEDFNTVMIFDEDENVMVRTPYSGSDDGRIEFRAVPSNKKITFALINISE